MKKQTLFAVALCAVAAAVAAEPVNLVPNGDFSQGKKDWQCYGGKVDANKKTMTLNFHQPLYSKAPIKVDTKANYKMTVKLASTVPGVMYAGLVSLDKDGKDIGTAHVSTVFKSDSTLLEPVAAGADTIKVKTAPNWKMHRYPMVAFNTKPDRSDLPNYDVMGVKAVTAQADGIEVKLSGKTKKEYPAGTGVRMHTSGATYIYLINFPKEAVTQSTELVGFIGPKYSARFRTGTDSVKIYFYVAGRKASVTIEEIKFEKLDAPAAK